jgi:hypothetical protein
VRKIVITPEVRNLLRELDETMEKFNLATKTLTERGISDSEAMRVGADRESIRVQLLGIVNRLNKASTRGKK